MTWVKVADGQAVNHDGQYLEGGSLLEVEDRLAEKWLERQVSSVRAGPRKRPPHRQQP